MDLLAGVVVGVEVAETEAEDVVETDTSDDFVFEILFGSS